MYTLNNLIEDLEIIRDNYATGNVPVQIDLRAADNQIITGISGGCGNVVATVRISTTSRSRPNHTPEIDARMADDLRKMSHFMSYFRTAASHFSQESRKPYDREDPDRFKRLRSSFIETWKDVRMTAQHMGADRY